MALSSRYAPPSPLPVRGTLVSVAQAVTCVVLRDGGQRTARRNAWAGMSENAQRTRARREADLAVQAAATRSHRTSRTG